MPYQLPEGFPRKLSDKQAQAAADAIMAEYRRIYGDKVEKWLPELKLALVSLVLSDLSRRQLVRGGWIALASLLVGCTAMVVAVVTLIVATN
jgi:hypothetical protein